MTAGSGDCNLPPAALTGYRYRQTGLLATGYWLAAFTVTVAPVRSGAQ
jgi:hypothetical protein